MTNRQVGKRFGWAVSLGLIGTTGMAVLAADGTAVTSTFLTTAEKFGIFAAMNLFLVGCAVYGLWRLVQYIIGRMEAVIDDNTIANCRLANELRSRPCQRDSAIDRISEGQVDADDSGDGDAVMERVVARRNQRATKKVI